MSRGQVVNWRKRFVKKFIAMLALVSLFGCGNAGSPTTSTAADTSTTTATPPPALLTPELKAAILKEITTIGASAVDVGFSEWSKSNNKVATEVATALSANIEATVLPVLNNQAVSPSAALAAVTQNLYVNIPPLIQLGIEGASAILDLKFAIPGVQDSDKVDFIKAFVTAIDNGCKTYLASPPPIGKLMFKHIATREL